MARRVGPTAFWLAVMGQRTRDNHRGAIRMSPLSDLGEVLFPVSLAPLVACTAKGDRKVDHSRAVVDARSGRVLSVVGRDYRLITHEQALELAFECVAAAFPQTRRADWHVGAAQATSSGAACCFDLQHSTGQLEFAGLPAALKPDVFGPFVRVVNSYNHSRALSFNIGYYRKVCRNGLILRDSVVSLHFQHSRRSMREQIHFDVEPAQLARQRAAFRALLARLRCCAVPAESMTRLACVVLGFRAPPLDPDVVDPTAPTRAMARQRAWELLEAAVEQSCRRFREELGDNAYAVLNAVTDLASRPPANPLVRRDRHALQRRAGQWLGSFLARLNSGDFDLQTYLQAMDPAA